MIHFVFEDVANIMVLCALLGIGAFTFIGVTLIYIASYFLMEHFSDSN